MEYLIRPVQRNELPRVIEMCRSHAQYERADYDPAGKAEQLVNVIFSEASKLYCFVVEYQSSLIGYFTYTIDFSTWDARSFMYLDCLYLEPEYRGLKIGEAIFDRLKNLAAVHDCIAIQWQTPDFNERAIKFYHRIGAKGKNKVRFSLTL